MPSLLSSPILVKFGGAAMEDTAVRDAVCKGIAEITHSNIPVVVTHGGGKEISRWITRCGGTPQFVDGIRVTDSDTMAITEMVLSGAVNGDLTSRLTLYGVQALGLSGRSSRILTAAPLKLRDGLDLGLVGEVIAVGTKPLMNLLCSSFVPVISPISQTAMGEVLNVNADYAAGAIAGALQCSHCIFLSDIEGVRNGATVVPHLTSKDIQAMIDSKHITGGMIPKVECALRALEGGCRKVTIAAAAEPRIIERLIQGESLGTEIVL